MMLSMFAPASRFSKIADTGIRVPFKTHAPLTLPGMLSTAGHCDQSRVAISLPSFYRNCLAGLGCNVGSSHLRQTSLGFHPIEHGLRRAFQGHVWGRGRL